MEDVREQAEKEIKDLKVDPVIRETLIEERASALQKEAGKPQEQEEDGKSQDQEEFPEQESTQAAEDSVEKETDEQEADDVQKQSYFGLDEDEAKKRIEGYEEIQKERDALKKEYEYVLDSVKEKSTDENIAKLQKLIGDGIEMSEAAKLLSTDVSEMSELDALKFQYKIDHPEYAGNDALVERKILSEYDVDSLDEIEDEMDKRDISIKAKSAKKTLEEKLNVDVSSEILPDDIKTKLKEQEEQAKITAEEREKAWKEIGDTSFKQNFKKLAVPSKDGDDISQYMQYELPEGEVDKYAEKFVEVSKGLEPTKENAQAAYDYVRMIAEDEHRADIIKGAVNKAIADYQSEQDAEKSNPTPQRSDKKPKSDKAAKAKADIDSYLKERGIK